MGGWGWDHEQVLGAVSAWGWVCIWVGLELCTSGAEGVDGTDAQYLVQLGL